MLRSWGRIGGRLARTEGTEGITTTDVPGETHTEDERSRGQSLGRSGQGTAGGMAPDRRGPAAVALDCQGSGNHVHKRSSPVPARIILDMWRRVEELTALPDLEYITKLPEIRALLACIVCYITGSRPSSIALLPLTGVAFALDSELGIQRSYVKTAPDACDFDVPGRRTVTWPVTTTWQTLGKMLTRYDRMRRRVCSRATYFFNLGEKARGDAFARRLPVAPKSRSRSPAQRTLRSQELPLWVRVRGDRDERLARST
ncbi:hypothetical protein RI054_06g31690 [Pseudoscourfieldia marina]